MGGGRPLKQPILTLTISASPRMSTTTAPFAAASASSLAEETAAILSFFPSGGINKREDDRARHLGVMKGRNAVGKEYRGGKRKNKKL